MDDQKPAARAFPPAIVAEITDYVQYTIESALAPNGKPGAFVTSMLQDTRGNLTSLAIIHEISPDEIGKEIDRRWEQDISGKPEFLQNIIRPNLNVFRDSLPTLFPKPAN